MKPHGYITLKEASELSGISIETLKKQCQSGRIRGSIKEAGSWFVPRDEIIIKPLDANSAGDDALILLTLLAESAEVGVNVTLYLEGLVIEGLLISTKKYVSHMRENLKIGFGFDDAEAKNMVDAALNGYFENILQKSHEGRPQFVHLEQVTVKLGTLDYEPKTALLRLKLDSIVGLQLGTIKEMDRQK